MIGHLAVLAAVLLSQAAQAPARPEPPEPERIAEGVWRIPGSVRPPRQPDGATTVFETADGLVVIDTGRHPWHREAILALAERTGRPVAAVVNTHWHLDHISGNADLKRAFPAARVYASGALDGAVEGFLRPSAVQGRAYLESGEAPPELAEDIRGDLASMDAIDTLRPDVVVTADRQMVVGGRTLDLRLAAHAATEGDVWIVDPATGTVVAGDLVTLPAPFLDTACPEGWADALRTVADAPFQRLVPGHGPVMSRANFDRYRAAFDGLLDCARSERASADCAADWTSAVRPLLANDGEARLATGMTARYVDGVLRSPVARERFCPTGDA